jgi:acyl carrier protein
MEATTWGSLFDAALSAAPMVFPGPPRLRMPGQLREVAVHGDPPREALASIRRRRVRWDGSQADDVEVDITLADPQGTVVARLSGVRFGGVRQAALPADGGGADTDLLELPDHELSGYVDSAVRAIVASELRLDPGDLDGHRPLAEMGADSLLSESIRQKLARQFRVPLPGSLLWDRPSVTAVAAYLCELLSASRAERPAA